MLKLFQLQENSGTRRVIDAVGLPGKQNRVSVKIFFEGLCKKMLEAMTMAEHEGNVFCKQCYARKFGIRGVGFGVGAGALAMDTGDRFGNTESLS